MPESNGPSGREWGHAAELLESLDARIEEANHRARGDRQVAVDHSERLSALEKELMKVRHETALIATRIYTTISVVAVVASIMGFSITLLAPWMRPTP